MFRMYLKDENFVEPRIGLYYLLAQDGLYQVKENACFKSSVKVDGLSDLQGHQETVELLLAPIPFKQIEEGIFFFREVLRQHGSEAVLLIYYSPEKRCYQMVAPIQYVSETDCDYELAASPSGHQLVGTIHSHPKGHAFHSSVDDTDEIDMDGLHITVGDLNEELSYSCSLTVDGRRAYLPVSRVFSDFKTKRVAEGRPSKQAKRWLDQVTKKEMISIEDVMSDEKLMMEMEAMNPSSMV